MAQQNKEVGPRMWIAVSEARGLDVTPKTMQKMRSLGDKCSAELLNTIYQVWVRAVVLREKRMLRCRCRIEN